MRGFFGVLCRDEYLLDQAWQRFLLYRRIEYPDSPASQILLAGMRMVEFRPPARKGNLHLASETIGNLYFDELVQKPVNGDEGIALVEWCRFDNAEELCTQLNLPSGSPASYIILKAYQTWGELCVDRFFGDFTFVIWDGLKKELFMAKDQLGIRPLFYYHKNGLFLFATSIPLIKAAMEQPAVLNEYYIARELRNYPPTYEETFFKEIHRLAPAHCLIFEPDNPPQTRRYWELSLIELRQDLPETDYHDMLRLELSESVRRRIQNKTKIGCQLSGGMDSSAIAVLLTRLMNKEHIHTYSFVLNEITRAYSERGIDEKDTQQLILDYAGLLRPNHHEVEGFHFASVQEQLQVQGRVMGGYANSDAIWQDTLFKMASEDGVELVFSGFPGDEGVSTNGIHYFYEYLYRYNLAGVLSHLWYFRLSGLKQLIHYYRYARTGILNPKLHKAIKESDMLNPESSFALTLKHNAELFHPGFRELWKHRVCRWHTCLRCESEGAYANRHGIETVYPLADVRLLQLAYSLPVRLFRPRPWPRALFRNCCTGILPDRVRLQPKFNGAMTLAFAEFWHRSQWNFFKEYDVRNHLGLINTSKVHGNPDYDTIDNQTFKIKLLDYFIDQALKGKK